MGKFDLKTLLAEGKAPDLSAGAGREQIEYIDIDQIDDDPNNFYSMDGLDALAENIELIGLQQPLRVRACPGEPGRVVLVSGHRRRAAVRLLVDAGRTDLRELPCIRETVEGSDALRELRLIYANRDTRQLRSAEIARQAERVEALLYQLKEEGYEFPGRMRDHVAEACRVSKSKLSRLKVIRERLGPRWRPAYEEGTLREATAYALAQLPAEDQEFLFLRVQEKGENLRWLPENTVKTYGERLAAIDTLTCEARGGGPCTNRDGKRGKAVEQSKYCDSPCAACCGACDDLAQCKSACLVFTEEIRARRADAKAQRKHEKEVKAEQDRPVIDEISKYWRRFGEARNAAGKSIRECYVAMDRYFSEKEEREAEALERMEGIKAGTSLPYGYTCGLTDVRRFVRLADLLGCSLDYLLCRTDDPEGAPQPQNGTEDLQWISGDEQPTKDKQLAAGLFVLDDMEPPVRMLAEWDAQRSAWRITGGGAKIDAMCAGWFPLPGDG